MKRTAFLVAAVALPLMAPALADDTVRSAQDIEYDSTHIDMDVMLPA